MSASTEDRFLANNCNFLPVPEVNTGSTMSGVVAVRERQKSTGFGAIIRFENDGNFMNTDFENWTKMAKEYNFLELNILTDTFLSSKKGDKDFRATNAHPKILKRQMLISGEKNIDDIFKTACTFAFGSGLEEFSNLKLDAILMGADLNQKHYRFYEDKENSIEMTNSESFTPLSFQDTSSQYFGSYQPYGRLKYFSLLQMFNKSYLNTVSESSPETMGPMFLAGDTIDFWLNHKVHGIQFENIDQMRGSVKSPIQLVIVLAGKESMYKRVSGLCKIPTNIPDIPTTLAIHSEKKSILLSSENKYATIVSLRPIDFKLLQKVPVKKRVRGKKRSNIFGEKIVEPDEKPDDPNVQSYKNHLAVKRKVAIMFAFPEKDLCGWPIKIDSLPSSMLPYDSMQMWGLISVSEKIQSRIAELANYKSNNM